MRSTPFRAAIIGVLLLVACGTDDAATGPSPSVEDAGTSGDASPVGRRDGGPESDGSVADAATDSGGGAPDPDLAGPYAIAEKDGTTKVAGTGDTVAIHAAYPTAAGSYPVIVIGHGFQLAASQYYGYAKRLASFGYVALTVDYPAPFSGNDNPKQAADMVAGIDWAKADSTFGASVDATKAGMTGHSLGGKVALLAATLDPRVKAAFVLDPVDGGGPTGCMAPKCVGVAALMPSLKIPTGILGETTDATGGFQACAPAASNFATFYAGATTPSLQITATGANHMSFLDDLASCGFTCSLCNAATAKNADVTAMARAFMVAFYERHLRGNTAYDAYLTGALAQSRYVATSRASITSK